MHSRKGHCCSTTGLRFNSQYLHGSLQPSLTLTPGYQCPILASSHTRHVFSHRHTCGQNAHTHLVTDKTLIHVPKIKIMTKLKIFFNFFQIFEEYSDSDGISECYNVSFPND